MTEYSLTHRENLLYDVVKGLHSHEDKPLHSLKVTFMSDEGEVLVAFLGAWSALDAIAQDLYFDENYDWKEACSARVETY